MPFLSSSSSLTELLTKRRTFVKPRGHSAARLVERGQRQCAVAALGREVVNKRILMSCALLYILALCKPPDLVICTRKSHTCAKCARAQSPDS